MLALKFLYKNLDYFKTRFTFVFLISAVEGAASFFIPVLLAEFTKQELTSANFKKLLVYIVALYVISLALSWIIRRYGEAICRQFSHHIRLKYFSSLEKLPVNILTKHHSGYLLSLINRVSDGLTPIMFDIFWTFARSLSNMTLFFYFTALESVPIALLNLFVLIVFIAISVYLSRKMVVVDKELNIKRASLMQSYVDFMVNILTVKKLGLYSFAKNKLDIKTTDNYQQIQKLQNLHSNRWLFLHSLFGIALLSTIGFLLFQVSTGKTSAAVLILFVAAYAIIRRNVERLSENFRSIMEMNAYLRTLDEVIEPAKYLEKKEKEKTWSKIEFKDVIFQYPETLKQVKIPYFSLNKKGRVCIIGKSGEGKTTFLNLIANFFEPQEGVRLIDNQPYKNFDKRFFNKNFAFVSQEVELFNISLRENITLGQNLSEETIKTYLEELDLLPWTKSLPEGLETIVGEKGVKLSAGQKQRINLLRSVCLNREIYLLDEPTSHLDKETERKIIKFLEKHLIDKTAIIVTHNESLVKLCTRKYLMENNNLIATKE